MIYVTKTTTLFSNSVTFFHKQDELLKKLPPFHLIINSHKNRIKSTPAKMNAEIDSRAANRMETNEPNKPINQIVSLVHFAASFYSYIYVDCKRS